MRQKGFTLIELLIVIGIIAILSAVVTVNYVSFRKTSQLDATSQQIISTLRDAQSRSVAAKEGARYGVYFSSNAGSDDQYMLFQGNDYAEGTVIQTYTVPSSLGLSTIDFAGLTSNEVVFDELLGTTPNYGYVSVTLTSTGQNKEISVNTEGRIGEYFLSQSGFPGSFSLDTPANGTILTTTTPTFTWDPAVSAFSYTLWHSTDPRYATYTEIAGITAHPTSPSYTLGIGEELENQARNYWKVKAIGTGGERWSDERDWYANVGINDPPAAFVLLLPDDSATENTNLTPAFDWEDTTDPNGSPITYTLEHSTNSSFPVGSKTSIPGISLSEYTLQIGEELANNTVNYWRVIAVDELGMQTVCSDVFRTLNVSVNLAPGAFHLLSPANGGYENTTTPSLDWEDSIDPNPSDTVTYTLWYSSDPTFSSKVEISGLASSNYTIPGSAALPEGQTFYWKVKAIDNHGASTWSSEQNWSFYVNRQPSAFDLVAPVDGAAETGASISFDWNDSTDPDVGDTVTYHIQVDNDPSFGSPEIDVSGLTSSNYSGSGLANGAYYWRVEAVDNHGYGRWSNQTWSFIYSSCDWHVDQSAPPGGDGLSWGSAFQTIGAAVSSLSGGDRVCVANGSYKEEVRLDSSHSGSAGNYTTFINKSGDNKVTVFDRYYSFRLDDADYVEVSGINIDSANNGYGFYLRYGSSNNKFHDLNIHDGLYGIRMYAGAGNNNNNDNEIYNIEMWNLASRGVRDEESKRNIYHNLTIRDCTGAYGFYIRYGEDHQVYDSTVYNLAYAIYDYEGLRNIYYRNVTYDTTSSYGNRIDRGEAIEVYKNEFYNHNYTLRDDYGEGNLYYDNIIRESSLGSRYGIYSRYGTKNQFYGNQIYGHSRGLYFYRDMSSLVYKNQIYKNDSYNYFYYPTGTQVYDNEFNSHLSGWTFYIRNATNFKVHHNLLSNNSQGLYSYRSGAGTHIYNNTIYGDSSSYGLYLYRFDGNTKIRNNIVTNNLYGFYVGNGNTNLDNDYADVWGNVNNFGGQGSAYQGANSISEDPLFMNPGSDFRLNGASPCIDRGDPDPFYNDPDGSRSDIGAFPFTP